MSLCSLNTVSAIGTLSRKDFTLLDGLMYFYRFETADISDNTLKNNKPGGTYDLTLYSSTSNATDTIDTTLSRNGSASLKLRQSLASVTPNVITNYANQTIATSDNRTNQTIAFKFIITVNLVDLRTYNTLFSCTTGSGGIVFQIYKDAGVIKLRYVTYNPVRVFDIANISSSNTWHSFAMTRTSSSFITYINGVQQTIDTGDNNIGTFFQNSLRFTFGIQANTPYNLSSEGFNGNIDDFRVYDRALSIQEIQAIHNSTS